ncbi:MAG: hypothetical protein SFX73_20780 [Kofleriaceae bacterium]|nr:hypothetical protein [Kofleriaceae bacterium]
MSSKAARKQRRRERERLLRESARPHVSIPEPVFCAEADLERIVEHLVTISVALDELEVAAEDSRTRWAAADHVDELRLALEEIHETARSWRARLSALEERVARFRQLGDHYHLVGGRLMRLVPVEEAYADPVPNDDIPF